MQLNKIILFNKHYFFLIVTFPLKHYTFSNEKIKLSMEAIYILAEHNFLTSKFALKIENYTLDSLNVDYSKIKLKSNYFAHQLTSKFIEKKAENLYVISFDFDGKYRGSIENLSDGKSQEEVVILLLEGIFLGDEELKLEEVRMITQQNN